MLYLACYDIENSQLRTKLAHCLLAHGLERLQFSVFVGKMEDPVWTQLILEVQELLHAADLPTIKFMLMPLAESYAHKSFWLGADPPDWPYHCHQTHTLIL